jgi:hypothetical protein
MALNINIPAAEPAEEIVQELVDDSQQVKTSTGSPYWVQAKLKYFHENLKEGCMEPYTLKKLSEDMGLNYGSLRQISWSEGWNKELEEMRVKKTEALMNRIMEMQVLSEMDIRLRQAHVARVAQAKALEHLQHIDPKKMKTSDAISLLQLGMQEERKALGMAAVPTESPQDKQQKEAASTKKNVMEDALKLIDNIKSKQAGGNNVVN